MYNKLKAIYNRERLDVFSMAVSHLLDIGFRQAKKITDDDIGKMEGNGIMTQDFVQHLVKLSREIAQACDDLPEIIQFCEAEEVFDISYYANKPSWSDLEKVILDAIETGSLTKDDFEYHDEAAEYFHFELEEEV